MSYNEKLKRKKIDNLFSDQQRNLRCQTEPLEHQHYHPSSPLLIWRNHIRRPPTPSCQCSCHHHCDVIGERSSGDDKIKPCLANISTNDYYSTLSTSNDYTNLCIYDNLFKPITTNDNDNFSQQHHSDCLTRTNEISISN
ncbi:hypothetical protein QR98_0007660 [Sarcoptes scabiei]|uniref:Uncharacterized protein n=1 Tax=Sarcoptes scabiei TaxID=52283 RepID=A0A131ZUC1_SARSC|nr:hypothetical protein QR98_0007660 [Sarcoptes scabiei]